VRRIRKKVAARPPERRGSSSTVMKSRWGEAKEGSEDEGGGGQFDFFLGWGKNNRPGRLTLGKRTNCFFDVARKRKDR